MRAFFQYLNMEKCSIKTPEESLVANVMEEKVKGEKKLQNIMINKKTLNFYEALI